MVYSATGLILTMEAITLYTTVVRHLWRPPRVRFNNVAGNAAAVNAARRGRSKHLRESSGILTDVFRFLRRDDVDACELVCRNWLRAVEEHARELSLRALTVTMWPSATVILYLGTCDRGSVQGEFLIGLRNWDKPFFCNAVLDVRTSGVIWLGRSTTKAIRTFLHKTSLTECNIKISTLGGKVSATELCEFFQAAESCSARSLELRYARESWTSSEEEVFQFIEAVFDGPKDLLQQLSVSIKDVRLNSCTSTTKVGLQLLSKIMHCHLAPTSECLKVCVPRLERVQLIRLLMENFTEGAVLPARLIVEFPATITLAQLWPNNLDYFDDARGRWVVTVGCRRLIMHIKSPRREITSYTFTPEWDFVLD